MFTCLLSYTTCTLPARPGQLRLLPCHQNNLHTPQGQLLTTINHPRGLGLKRTSALCWSWHACHQTVQWCLHGRGGESGTQQQESLEEGLREGKGEEKRRGGCERNRACLQPAEHTNTHTSGGSEPRQMLPNGQATKTHSKCCTLVE